MNIRCTSANAYPSAADCSGLLTHHSRPDATSRKPVWSSALLAAEIRVSDDLTTVTTIGQHLLQPTDLTLDPTQATVQVGQRFLGDLHPTLSSIVQQSATEVDLYPVGYRNPTIDHLPRG